MEKKVMMRNLIWKRERSSIRNIIRRQEKVKQNKQGFSYKDLGFSENSDVKFVCATDKDLYFKLSKNEIWRVELKQQKDGEVPDSDAKKVFESDSEIQTFSICKNVVLYCD